MVSSIEGDGVHRPLEVRWCGCVDRADLSKLALPLTRSEASRASPKDQEAVPDVGEACPLRIVALILRGLFRVLLGRGAGVETT